MLNDLVFLDLFAENKREAEKNRTLLKRKFDVEYVEGKAIVITGPRRAGKSTFAKQLHTELFQGAAKKKSDRMSIEINFADERLAECKLSDLQRIIPLAMTANERSNESIDFFIDEIQLIDQWELWIERLLRNSSYRVVITGSNSKMLSREIGTTMRGRSLSYEIFPFSFHENLAWLDIKHDRTAEAKVNVFMEFKKYLFNGGFPEVIKLSEKTRVKTLQEYREVMILKDVIERHGTNPILTQKTFQLLVNQFSAMTSLNKTVEKLKSQSLKASKTNIAELFEWFQETYFLHFVPLFSESVHKQNINPKKTYFVDTGFVAASFPGISSNTGRLLENAVFMHLRRHQQKIFYWKNKDGKEVDFFVEEKILIQVCESLQDEATAEREISALRLAMKELSISIATVVTLNEERLILVPEGTIEVVSAGEWFLK